MTGDTGTWHYGLVARWWAEVNALEADELDFYRGEIERSGEPALDLGCGTGRLLVPLLLAGLDVDGVDISSDMLARARAAAAAAGIDAAGRLAQGTFAGFAMPRRYATIVCCDSFGIGGDRAADEAALANVRRHLLPGGVFTLSLDRAMPEALARMTAAAATYPASWPDAGVRGTLADGDELELLVRTGAFDPATRVERMDMRARLWRGGRVVEEEAGSLRSSMYFADEVVAMAREAGFGDIEVEARYTRRPAEPDDETVVVRARAVE
jgi:SAM-dependent methyltransferase